MIQFDQVSFYFADHLLFKDVSFTLQKGERCGLVGRNGSGKSTLFRLINQEIEPDQGIINIPKHYRIGYLKQQIQFSQPTIVQEAALGLPSEEREQIYRAEKILFGLGFNQQDLDASPEKFSGGYHLRLHLAQVLVSDPHCLLLDEPTNYLDLPAIRWLKQFLKNWKGELILISHDREFMDQITTHTLGIHREKIKKIKGTSINFFEQILLEEEVHEKTRAKADKRRAHMQTFVDRFGAKASKAAQARSRMKMIKKEPALEKLNQLSNLSFEFHEAPFPGKKMLDAKQLRFSYTGQPLIENFSLEIEKGERVAIIGKNGRGKSTLLRLLVKDLIAQQGALQYSENTQIGYFGQTHIDRLNPLHTIEEEIALSNPRLNHTETKAIAGMMMFSASQSEKKIQVLSGGEKSRVLLGKILAHPCNLLALDEPTHHLDIESIEALIDALEVFDGAILLVTHSELILQRLALDKIIYCEDSKQTLFLGTYDEFLEKNGWGEETPLPKKNSSPPQKQSLSKAATLKPLERKIQDCEKEIIALEEEQKTSLSLLESGNTTSELLRLLSLQSQKLEQLNHQLYELYDLLEKLKK